MTEPARLGLPSMCCPTKTAPARWSRATGLGKLGADDLDTAGSPPTPLQAVFAEEIETWLAIRPIVQPELPIVWTPHNGTCSGGIAVHIPEHLAAFVSSLSRIGAFSNVHGKNS